MFQSTPPHGGRLDPVPVDFSISVFQSTPPHGGRLQRQKSLDLKLFQGSFRESPLLLPYQRVSQILQWHNLLKLMPKFKMRNQITQTAKSMCIYNHLMWP